MDILIGLLAVGAAWLVVVLYVHGLANTLDLAGWWLHTSAKTLHRLRSERQRVMAERWERIGDVNAPDVFPCPTCGKMESIEFGRECGFCRGGHQVSPELAQKLQAWARQRGGSNE